MQVHHEAMEAIGPIPAGRLTYGGHRGNRACRNSVVIESR
jgi:hypothetical protein